MKGIKNIILVLTVATSLIFSFESCSEETEPVITNGCDECELEPNVGPCNAAFPKFYFDKNEGKCKEFIWGGCGGVVPFETLEECQACECI